MDIIIDLSFVQIKWYSVLILISFLIGYFLILNTAKHYNINKSKVLDLVCYLIPICIIGARLYYCIFEWNYYSNNIIDIIKIWEGGLAIHGGIIAGLLYLIHFCRKNKLNLLDITDIISPALILGQAIGRWGNFFNQEAYGPITTYSYLKRLNIPEFIIKGMNINGNYHIPTFLYESLWCLIGFIIIIIISKIFKSRKGQITAIYFIFYGIGRVYIESLRQDSLMLSNVKVAQVISIIMIVFGILLLTYTLIKSPNVDS